MSTLYASHIIVAHTSPALWTSEFAPPAGPGFVGVSAGSGFSSLMWRKLSAFFARFVLYGKRRMPKVPGSVYPHDARPPPVTANRPAPAERVWESLVRRSVFRALMSA